LQATQRPATYYYCTAKIPFFTQILRSVSKWSLRTTPYKLVRCGYKNSGTDILRCHQTSFFFMRCSPNVVSSDDDDDDDPLIFLYFGAQALQTLWRCKKDKAKLQLRKKYFRTIIVAHFFLISHKNLFNGILLFFFVPSN